MEADFFLEYLPFIIAIVLSIKLYKDWYNKKHGIKEKEEENKSTKFNQSYFYKVFVERVKDRPNTQYFVFTFFVSIVAFIFIINMWFINPLLKLEEFQVEEGVVIKYEVDRRNNRWVTLLLDNKKEKVFKIIVGKDTKKQILNKRVILYYQNVFNMFMFYDFVFDVKVNNKLINDYPNIYYKNYLSSKETMSLWLIYFLISMIGSIFFIWLMNRKELPIHIENRKKRLNKKDK